MMKDYRKLLCQNDSQNHVKREQFVKKALVEEDGILP